MGDASYDGVTGPYTTDLDLVMPTGSVVTRGDDTGELLLTRGD
jgi:hypothetical protein